MWFKWWARVATHSSELFSHSTILPYWYHYTLYTHTDQTEYRRVKCAGLMPLHLQMSGWDFMINCFNLKAQEHTIAYRYTKYLKAFQGVRIHGESKSSWHAMSWLKCAKLWQGTLASSSQRCSISSSEWRESAKLQEKIIWWTPVQQLQVPNTLIQFSELWQKSVSSFGSTLTACLVWDSGEILCIRFHQLFINSGPEEGSPLGHLAGSKQRYSASHHLVTSICTRLRQWNVNN